MIDIVSRMKIWLISIVVKCNGDVRGVHVENLQECIRMWSHLLVTHPDGDARGEW